MLRFVVLLAIVLMSSTAGAAGPQTRHSVQWDAYFVRGSLSDKNALANALEGRGSVLKVSPEHLVRILGNEGVPETISVAAFVNYLRSPQVFEVSCREYNVRGTRMYRVSTDGRETDSTWTRGCYDGEKWLAYKDGQGRVIPFLSLSCGNPLKTPPPPVRHVEECVEIPVQVFESYQNRHTVAVTVRPTLHIWGPRIVGCGLQVAECYCVDPVTGKMAIAYIAQPVTGSGVVRIPRELAKRMEAICFMIDGYWPPKGIMVHRQMVIDDIRPLANSDATVVLPQGKHIGFYQSDPQGRPG